MIYIKTCPICNGGKFNQLLECKDHSKSKESFTIVSCETCGFILTNPRPATKELADYYMSEAYISHTNSTQGFFNWVYQKVRKHTIKKKVSLLKNTTKKGNLLDVGSGTGEFLNRCEEEGFKTRGIEPSKIARKKAIKNYDLRISENPDIGQYTSNNFDMITMWHVLEHIPDLKNTIKEFNRVLKKGGKIIVAVPNHKSWDAKYYKQYWAAWDVPIHLWHFSRKTIEKLFNNHGFVLKKTKPMIFDSFYVSILSEEYISGKKNFVKGFLIGLISNIYAIISKRGHSSMIYIFEKN